MPDNIQAELIEEIVSRPAVLRFRSHDQPNALMVAWFSNDWLATVGVELADNLRSPNF